MRGDAVGPPGLLITAAIAYVKEIHYCYCERRLGGFVWDTEISAPAGTRSLSPRASAVRGEEELCLISME